MKTLTLLFLITINFSMYAQESIFVRVYNSAGTKISKGHVLIVTDSSLQLSGEKSNIIPVSSIGYIKTKRSEGNNILIGSIVGTTSGVILSALEDPSDAEKFIANKTTSVMIGGLFGMGVGAGIGGLSSLLKKSKTYFIEGDLTKWKAFQLMVTGTNFK